MAAKLELKGYKTLLVALVVILLIFPTVQDFAYVEFIIGVVLVGVLLAAVHAVANRRRQVVISGLLGATASIGYFGNLMGFGATFEVMSLLGFGLFFLFVGMIIMMNIMLHIQNGWTEPLR